MSENMVHCLRWTCILFLAVEWLGFGVCHFLFREATEAQVPDYFPYKTVIAVLTGLAELVAGVLILIPRVGEWESRRWAAILSLVLLSLYIPAVYNLLVNDAAVGGSESFRRVVRIILVPNNLILALCALYLLWDGSGRP